MAVLLSVTSGWTGRLGPFTLRVDGTPQNLTGLSIALILRRYDGTVFTATGVITPAPNQSTNPGEVYYDPIATDFVWTAGVVPQQNYHFHWKITDGAGKVVTFPNGGADQIAVYQQ